MGLFGLSLAAASTALADDTPAARIGRVAVLSGAVQYRSPAGGWSSALVNEPVAAGFALRSRPDASAELAIADARVALAGNGELQFARLDRDAADLVLPRGRIFVHLGGSGAAASVEIDLPNGGVWLAVPGDYAISAGDAQTPARVEVFAGSAALGGGLGTDVLTAAPPDDVEALARTETGAAEPAGPLPPEVTGDDRLAANGKWENDDTFGSVWYPRDLPDNWAPYRYGRWRYLPPWGWTWIDDAEWGFAPSHYGAWERINDRWAWVPGSNNPAFTPAAVAFIGTPGIGLSRPGNDGAAVAWFPLAPGEAVDDGSDPHYRNRRSASVVPRAVFAAGQPVQSSLLDLPERRLDDAPVVTGALGIAPSSEGGSGFVAAAAPSPVAQDARVVSVPLVVKPAAATATSSARHKLVFARLIHNVLAHAARASSHRPHAVRLALARPRAAPSTSAVHSPHNRRHLAAARRGGVQ